jgi:hypothetical protein
MSTRWCRMLLRSVLGLAVVFATTQVAAQPLDDSGFGFVLRSTNFGDPCTSDDGNVPRIYDNATAAPVDVSFRIINTGGSILFIVGTGFVIPPDGPGRRPRVIRIAVSPGGSIGIKGQTAGCGWTAIIRPH